MRDSDHASGIFKVPHTARVLLLVLAMAYFARGADRVRLSETFADWGCYEYEGQTYCTEDETRGRLRLSGFVEWGAEVDISLFNSNTMFYFWIGNWYGIWAYLEEDPNYQPGKTSASFPIGYWDDDDVWVATPGRFYVKWNKSGFRFVISGKTGVYNDDAWLEEALALDYYDPYDELGIETGLTSGRGALYVSVSDGWEDGWEKTIPLNAVGTVARRPLRIDDEGRLSQIGGEQYERVSISVQASEWHSRWAEWPIEQGGNGHWYQPFWSPEPITWTTAFTNAQLAGGYLATITTAEENAFVFHLVNHRSFWTGEYGPYLGGYQPPGTGNPAGWTWITGEPWSYTNWGPDQPGDNGSNPSGIHFWGGYSASAPADKWNDLAADSAVISSYVVERETVPAEQERSRTQWGLQKR